MANTPPLRPTAKPAVDEWGVYDPQQAGLAALFAKIDSRKDAPMADNVSPATPATSPRPTLRDAK